MSGPTGTVATPVSAVYATNLPAPKTPNTPATETKNRAKSYQNVRDRRHSPIHVRNRLSENYEPPASGREGWWRATIRETPAPGAYESETFLKEVLNRPNTYRFKTDGRKRDPLPQIGKGDYLLPGAYEARGFVDKLDGSQVTYCFKDTGRDQRDYMNFGKKDKDVNVAPGEYEAHKYNTMTVDRQPSKHWVFKSQSQRFPTMPFKPRDGPAPGMYEYVAPPGALVVSSSFKSRTPRFSTSHTKVPGPGTYEKTYQSPIPKTVLKMGRQHGIFFSSAFQV